MGMLAGFLTAVLGAMRVGGMPGMWGMWGSGSYMMPWGMGFLGGFGLLGMILGAVAIVGGIFALRRRHWGLSLAGAICATLMPVSFLLGVAAIVFIAMSHEEFEA